MKIKLRDLATAILQTASTMPKSELPKLIDAAAETLAHKGQSGLMRGLPEELRRTYYEMSGIMPVTVLSAEKLTASQQKSLQKALETYLNSTIDLTVKIDPSLIEGMRIVVGDERFDFSMETELAAAGAHLSFPAP